MTDRPRSATLLVAFSFAVAMFGTTLPTPLYPLYEKAFAIPPVLTPVIFATYAAGVICALSCFGYLSDEIGRRPMMFVALGLSAASSGVFLLAGGLATLLVGRVLSGLSSGIATGAGTAWLVDLAGKKAQEKATRIAVAANVGGLACGPLLAGLLARLAPAPLRVSFAVDLALLVPATIAVFIAPETVDKPKARVHLRLQKMKVPSSVSEIFPRAAIAGICGFAVAGVFSAVAPSFLGKELHHASPISAGLLVFLFFTLGVLGQLGVGLIPKRAGLTVGCVVLLVGLGLLAGALVARSAVLLFLSAGASGLGQGLAVGCGLGEMNDKLNDKRGETDSAYFVLLYAGVAVPVVGVGFLGLATGITTAGIVFCSAVALGIGAVLVMLARRPAET